MRCAGPCREIAVAGPATYSAGEKSSSASPPPRFCGHAAHRSRSRRWSQLVTRFQLALVWSTNLRSLHCLRSFGRQANLFAEVAHRSGAAAQVGFSRPRERAAVGKLVIEPPLMMQAEVAELATASTPRHCSFSPPPGRDRRLMRHSKQAWRLHCHACRECAKDHRLHPAQRVGAGSLLHGRDLGSDGSPRWPQRRTLAAHVLRSTVDGRRGGHVR